jgi:hypothetical protein
VTAQATTGRDRLLVAGPVSVNHQRAPSLSSVIATAIDAGNAAPSPPSDLFLRIHVLLI